MDVPQSGGFLYDGETVFGSRACRQIPQASPANRQPQAQSEPVAPAKQAPINPPLAEQPAQNTPSANLQDVPTTAPTTTEKASVVLYRPSRFVDAARKVTIYIDNRPLCVLSNSSHFNFEVTTGTHSLATLYFRNTKGEVAVPESQFTFVSGQTYYFALSQQGLVLAVPAQKGESESRRTKPIKESSISFQPTGNEVK